MALGGSIGEYALGEFVQTLESHVVSYPTYTVEMYLSGSWVDVSADIRDTPHTKMRRGIGGSDIKDRIAETGTMSFSLDNSTNNSGGLLGYYSPDNANCRTGFGIGTRVRWSITISAGTWYKFHGKISDITPRPGQFNERYVEVVAVDYMDYLASTKLQRVAVQTGQRPDQIVSTIVATLPIAPLATSYATSPDTLAYAMDVDKDESNSAMTALQKLAQTDLSYVFVAGDQSGGETLTYQTRHTRLLGGGSSLTMNDLMTGLEVSRHVDRIYNDVRCVSYPVRIDAAATTVLASVPQEFSVPAGSSVTRTLRYRDPSGGGRVSGTDMVTPSDSTDYEFTATAGSGSNDLSGSVTVAASFGGNSAQVVLTNAAAVTAYTGGAETFQLRGKGVYPYDPVESIASDTASIDTYGTRSLVFDLPYQTNINVAESFSAELLSRYKSPASNIESVRFVANYNASLLLAGVSLDIGSRISILETVTGIDADFFINAVDYELVGPNILVVTWTLEAARNAGNIGNWGTNAADSGVWGTNTTDATDWSF